LEEQDQRNLCNNDKRAYNKAERQTRIRASYPMSTGGNAVGAWIYGGWNGNTRAKYTEQNGVAVAV
jgi:hypothetical protein